MSDMVARSRLNAVEAELQAAEAKLAKVQHDVGAEIQHLTSQLESAVSLRDEWQKRHDGQQVIIDNLRRMVEEYSDVLRDLASYVGCGGYNSEGNIPAKVAEDKIRWGIDHMLRVETDRRESAEWRLEKWHQEIRRLFGLLDDIDTAEDAYKPEQTEWFKYVHQQQRKRFDGITSTDGYTISIDDSPAVERRVTSEMIADATDNRPSGKIGLPERECPSCQAPPGEYHAPFCDIDAGNINGVCHHGVPAGGHCDECEELLMPSEDTRSEGRE